MHGTAFANYAVDDCDFLIALGARFDDRVAGVPAKFARNAKRIAHIDIDRAEVNKVKRVQWAHIGSMGEALRALTCVRQGAEVPAGLRPWHTHLGELKSEVRDELRSQQPAHPAVLRHRRDQQAREGPGDHRHRRRPASDVGRAVLRFPRAAPVAHLGQHGHDGLRPAGGHRRADREPEPARHRHRWRLQHPHERGRAGDRAPPTTCRSRSWC